MGGQSQAASDATRLNMQLSGEEFAMSLGALTSGLGYLKDEYAGGSAGVDKDLAPKFEAKMTDVLESASMAPSGGGFRADIAQTGRTAQGMAVGRSGVAQERTGQGLDVVNSIKSLLAGHGLKTTGLASAAGGLQSEAIGLMAKNPTMSTILGVAGAGSAIYGGIQDYKAGQSAQERLATFQTGYGPSGADAATLAHMGGLQSAHPDYGKGP